MWRLGLRGSVLECGCPLPLSGLSRTSAIRHQAVLPGGRAVPRLELARRPADAPPALTGGPVLHSSTAEGGLGKPGPTVQSRKCPSLLLGGCSRRSGGFVVAGTARVAGVLLGKGSGSGPAGVRGGSGNALCLQGFYAAFRIRRSLGCGCGVAVRNERLVATKWLSRRVPRCECAPPPQLARQTLCHRRSCRSGPT
jgi:hypothetical protein